jgi:hypothetical protein
MNMSERVEWWIGAIVIGLGAGAIGVIIRMAIVANELIRLEHMR